MTLIAWVLAGRASGGGGSTADVNINPGDDLVAEIAAAPAGSNIFISPGTYRITAPIVPKNSQTITGTPGTTIIDGSVLKTSWTSDGSGRWYSSHTFQTRDSLMRDATYSVCEISAVDGTNLCWNRDQAWWDGTRMSQVGSLATGDAATGNRFFIDRTNSRLYVWVNPSGHTVEVDVTPYAINDPAVTGVKMVGLTFQKFATPLQRGAVSLNAITGWEFSSCRFTGNHALGLFVRNSTNFWAHGCTFDANGQLGMGVGTSTSGTTWANVLVESCTFTGNNTEDFYIGDWEAGGFKTTSKSGGIVRNCTFSNNRGLDLWVDFGSQWIFEGNTCDGAWGQAIRIEVGSYCIVRNNIITNSGSNIGAHYRASHTNWSTVMDTCAISVSECSYAEVYGNTVNDPSLNGIIVNVRGRLTASASGSDHVFVHGNTVTQRQTPIPTGATGTSTIGTMIAGGINLSGAPQPFTFYTAAAAWTMPPVGGNAASGLAATRLVDVSGNHYRVGDLSTTRRFAYGAGSYQTATTYTSNNPADATDVTT